MITPIEIAIKYFPEYKTKGDEIVPMFCPFCEGGEHKDKYTFALNTQKLTYNCRRGTCGIKGHFKQLCDLYGEEYKTSGQIQKTHEKKYKTPQTEIKTHIDGVFDYFEGRGICKETVTRRGIGADEKGNICFPYYENGKLVMVKFRQCGVVKQGERKAWREEGGKPVFWGIDKCDPAKPLIIVEGEIDALTLDECGIDNVVSVPSGAEDLTCVDLCWDWLDQFKKIVIWGDNDEPGQEMVRKLILRLGEWRCYTIKSDTKDANETLIKHGKEYVKAWVTYPEEVPISRIVKLAYIEDIDLSKIPRVTSSMKPINKVLGGYRMGEITVWTGVNSSGKSTLLAQELVEAIDQKYKVCAFSGELPAKTFRFWVERIMAGRKNLLGRYDEVREQDVYYVNHKFIYQIRDWYVDGFFLYDSKSSLDGNDILQRFEYAYRRYDCRVFLIDNLMITNFVAGNEDYYRAQSNFVGRVVDFAHKFDVHVHMVAHPRKVTGKVTKQDIAGSADITNRVDNVLDVRRMTEDEKVKKYGGGDAIVSIFKNRFDGLQDKEVIAYVDPLSRRFSANDQSYFDKKYDWEVKR